MPTINYGAKEVSIKIVYYGPGLSGKTTNLRYIYTRLPQKHRGKMVSLATDLDQTLFFDFLPLDIGKIRGFTVRFHLYTVPGQVYYNVTRKLVLRKVDALVFVADSQKERLNENLESFENMIENLKAYNLTLDKIPCVIQYNKRDLPNILPVDQLNRALNKKKFPYFQSIAITGYGVMETLKEICKLAIRRVKVFVP
ncbi:gliding-motility protein MglA [candidate division WOR-3 bacterium]|uniref:Gliding-motility protein MglA n=1 Tax=candidate division WOR-3 bacterium TaxID=2052148 RepID=A0A660SDU0_UNCW3|nr:MAG: gliding-motility protein MglA [candidate division WOR-3 bacterium]